MNLAVDKPILNNPFEEPTRYWNSREKQPYVENGRRPAGYHFRARSRRPEDQLTLYTEEQLVELTQVNRTRERVGKWREKGYPGATPMTQRLLAHWNQPDRERKLFFCQREAVETVIWLVEVAGDRGYGFTLDKPVDAESLAKGYGALRRYGCKMATGSGKTVVMAMVAAWSILNRRHGGARERYSDAILVVCPNLTIKERLQVLKPEHPDNYYQEFDLVPPSLVSELGSGKFLITNWHTFAEDKDSRKRQVTQRGDRTDKAYADAVLKELGSRKNLLVLNDEAHHAYRPAPLADGKKEELSPEAVRDREEATEWVKGLDRITAARRVNFCLDLSATPFYLQGSGYPEGSPLPWLVSDFGLVDAIESGIVKIPRVPVASDSGAVMPEYFALWHWVMENLPAAERGRGRNPKPEGVLRMAEGALTQLSGEWKRSLRDFEKSGHAVPPCLVVVCKDTNLSQVFHEYIGEEGRVFPELLKNEPGCEVTLRIDSRLLAEAESAVEGGTKGDAAQMLREKVNTIGKKGQPGEQVRCVVSVAMLNEGWDAQNVTQILGLRPFQSQLLCEQVVGRGLRRTHYNFEFDEHGVPMNEEYVDVYGIPFEVIPVKKKPTRAIRPKESTLVKALEERKAKFEIPFPRVEGYVFQVRQRIKCDVSGVEKLTVGPETDPTATVVRAQVGHLDGGPSVLGPGATVTQTRHEFYESIRFQQIEFEIARRITSALLGDGGGSQGEEAKLSRYARHTLFPQVLEIVRQYLEERVDYGSADRREIGLQKYMQRVVERLCSKIEPDEATGEVPRLPRLERFRPRGSTSGVLFRTVKDVVGTTKSHVSHVALDSKEESRIAFALEQLKAVQAYVKNDHLDFAIPYDFDGQRHYYYPDYLVRLENGTSLIAEVKGYENEQDRQKYEAARRWVSAVNHWGKMGTWDFAVVRSATRLPVVLTQKVVASQDETP